MSKNNKRYTIEEIKEFVNNNSNCELLSKEYINNRLPLMFKCGCGRNTFETSFTKFKDRNKRQCNQCSEEQNTYHPLHKYEEIKNYFESFNYKLVLTIYKGQNEYLDVICPEGHSDRIPFKQFKLGQRCKTCSGYKRWNIEGIKHYVEVESGSGYKLLSTYYNPKEKISVQCTLGHIYDVEFMNFKIGNRCSECSGVKKYTYLEVKDYMENIGYILISEKYSNNSEHLIVECDKGHQYPATFAGLLNGKRCKTCAGLNKKTIREVREHIESFNYKLLSTEYINASMLLDVECPEGHQYPVTWNNFEQGQRCNICSSKKTGELLRHSFNYVKEFIEKEGYQLLSEVYIGCKEELIIKCQKNHIYPSTFDNFSQGSRCPKCNNSKGETNIDELLNSRHTVPNTSQYRFEDCRDKKPLPFDHAIFLDIEKTQIVFLIEFDGHQHDKPVNFGGISDERALENFKIVQFHDEIKTQYCLDNTIPLLRIHYKDFKNIEQILIQELKKYNLISNI